MKKTTLTKKLLVCAIAASMLVLAACADNAPGNDGRGDEQSSQAPSVTNEGDTVSQPLSDKIAPALATAPEFRAGGTLRNIRVYFDNAVVNDRLKEIFTDTETVHAYVEEHGMDFSGGVWQKIIAEEIKNEITSVLDAYSIRIGEDMAQFGTSSAYLTLSKITYGDLVSLSQDKKVTKIAALNKDSMISLSEGALKKVSLDDGGKEYGLRALLSEAMADDVFNVGILFDFMPDSGVDELSFEQMQKEYAAKKLGYAYEDIERLVKEATDYDTEHGRSEYNPTDEQDAKIREMIDAYQAARIEFYLEDYKRPELSEEDKALGQKRFTELLDRNGITVGNGIERTEDALTGEMSAAEIARLLEEAEVCYVWYEEPFVEVPECDGLFSAGNF